MVKIMAKSGLPCFKAGADRTVKGLEKRLALNLTEVQVSVHTRSWNGLSDPGFKCFPLRFVSQLISSANESACPIIQVVQMVLSLISDSLDAWRTRQYDYYQRVMNGIL